jgi:hypothetical protein
MITNLEIVDDETAKAFGQRFDVARVLDATVAFLRAFSGAIARAAPHVRPTIRFPGDGDRLDPLDEDAYARLRAETLGLARRYDVIKVGARVDIGTFALRCEPLGADELHRYGSAEPTQIDETSWRDLDPTPVIAFHPSRGEFPLFEPKALALLKELVGLHAPGGARPDFDLVPRLRFPHRAFDAGLGDLRIRLLTVPVEP